MAQQYKVGKGSRQNCVVTSEYSMALELGISRLVWLVSGGPGRTSDRWLSGRWSEERLDFLTVCRARVGVGLGPRHTSVFT